MRAIAVIGALTAIAVLVLGGPNAAPAARSSAEIAFDRGGWIYVAGEDGTGVRRLIRGSGAAFSPDGSRLAFARADRLYVARADGSGERELALAGRGYGVDWSPDGRKIAFTSHYRSGRFAVYVANADGTGVRRLVKPARRLEESDSPAWSPDGRLIAFASTRAAAANPEIYVARPDGTGLRRLTHTRGEHEVLGDDGMPSWSRDGKQIVFTSNRTGGGAIWVMRADGTGERKLYDNKGTDDFSPEFSQDGRRIVFSRLALDTTEVWIVGSDGGGARRVTAGGRPTWLPVRPSRAPAAAVVGAGRELAFVRGEASATEIYVVREDGSGLRRLTRNGVADYSPIWSPDGKRLLFVSNRDGDDELFVMDASGRNVRQLTRNRRQDLTPQWSPDGRLIAFASDRRRVGEPEIWVMRADGANAVRLIKTVNHPTWQDLQYSPVWSPDGKRLIFSMAAADSNPELYSVGRGGKGLKRLTQTAGSFDVFGDDTMPDWSGDEKTVAFVSNREQRSSDIWTMKPDGTGQRPLLRRPATDDWNPRLSPEGTHIAFTQHALPAGGQSVWVVDRDGSKPRRVTDGGEPDWRPARTRAPAALLCAPASAVRSRVEFGLTADVLFTRHIRGTGTSDLYIAKAHSSLLKRLTRDGMSSRGVFAPDGTQIAFASGRATGAEAPEIYVMDATGKNVRRITHSVRSARVFWQNTQPAWAPDAKSIVFVRTKITGTREETDLWRVDARGGSPARLTNHPGREANPAFTPDGRLGFDREGRIRILSRGSVIDTRSGADPTWSPDRTYLAFVKSDGIYLTLGQSERKIVEGGFSPAWSADGTQLIYQVPAGGLEAMTVIGRATEAVTRPPQRAADVYPSWRPSPKPRATAAASRAGARGGLIAFGRRTGTGRSELYLVRADGSGLRRRSSEPVDFDPAWMPDGKRIVFSTSRGGRAGAAELYVRNVSGTSVVRITNTPKSTRRWAANAEPAVVADGKRVIFVQERYSDGITTRDLYSVAISGGPLRQLTRTPGREASPTTGRSRAIYVEREGWIYELALGVTRRVARGVQPAKDPSDRGLVAFARAGTIFVSRGGPPVKVADGTGRGGFSEPAWSPDGTRLVFVAPDGLFTVALDGSDLRRLTESPSLTHDLAPAWQPEGGAR